MSTKKYIGLKNNRPEGQYISILGSDGTLRVASEEGAEGAIKRDYETSDGTKGTKWELVFTELSGRISDIVIKDTNYGRVLNLFIGDGADKFILSVNTENNFGVDIMKKLPNVALDVDVTIAPYSFDGDDGKKKKGVTITQDDTKLQSFFYDVKKKKSCNNLPEADEAKKPDASKKAMWKKFWKAYFSDVEDFLVEYTEKNVIPALEKINETKLANNNSSLKTSEEVREDVEKTDPLDDNF